MFNYLCLNAVSDQNSRSTGCHRVRTNGFFEQMSAHDSINSWKWVIKQINVCTFVQCPCEGNSRFLSARKVDSHLTDLCLIALWKNSEVGAKWTRIDHFLVKFEIEYSVSLLFIRFKNYVVSESSVQDPALLGTIRHIASESDVASSLQISSIVKNWMRLLGFISQRAKNSWAEIWEYNYRCWCVPRKSANGRSVKKCKWWVPVLRKSSSLQENG